MTDIEILREAARLMRERAQAATEGPWELHTTSTLYMSGHANYTIRAAGRPGIKVTITGFPADAEHIASWHPAVALAIADWLDAAAQREQEHRQRSAHYAYADPAEGDEVYGALIVARAYLGVES